jgi:hypothetical protein
MAQDAPIPGLLAGERLSPLTGAERMRLHRERKRKQLRCLTIEFREAEVDVLIRLPQADRAEPAALRKALYEFLDDHLR